MKYANTLIRRNFNLLNTKHNYKQLVYNKINFNLCFMSKVNNSNKPLEVKTDIDNIKVDKKSENNILTIKKRDEFISEFKDSVNIHFNQKSLPFIDIKIYKNILNNINKVKDFYNIKPGLYILNDLIEYQYNYFYNSNKEMLIEILHKLGEYECGKYKIYYLIEELFIKDMLKDINSLETDFIIKLMYIYAISKQGSYLFYSTIAQSFLKRKISKLDKDSYIVLYNVMKTINYDNKIFWIIMNKANKEKFKLEDSLLINYNFTINRN